MYDDYLVNHDYFTDVSTKWDETIRIYHWSHAASGQRVERYFITTYGTFIR